MSCGPSETPVPLKASVGEGDLTEYMNVGKASVRNNDAGTDVGDILGKTGLLKSDEDTDEQLLITVPFTEAVKLRSIIIQADEKGEEASAPLVVKVYVDKESLDFAEAESVKPSQEFKLTKEQLSGAPISLKYTNFKNVHTVTVFIETNQEDSDVTFLNRLSFVGTPIAGTNMNDLKKMG